MPRRKRKPRESYVIGRATYLDGLKEIEARIEELELDTESPKVVITGSKRDGTLGNHKTIQTSIERYEAVWQSFPAFCIEIREYGSGMLVHREKCPADRTPVNFQTAILYLTFPHTQARYTSSSPVYLSVPRKVARNGRLTKQK